MIRRLQRVNVHACAVCYGALDSTLTTGLNLAIMSLLIILVGVLSCVVVFLLRFRRRSKFLMSS